MRPACAASAARAAALAAVLAGCGTLPPGTAPTPLPGDVPASAPAVAGRGEVLARSERFIIYVPAPGETLRGIAARFLGSEEAYWRIGDFNAVARAEAGQALVVPLQPLNPLGVQADAYQTVPILCYHRFGPGGGKMVVSAASFAAQLDWLTRNDYHVIRLEQLLDYLEGRQALPRRSVVLTIDDGYASVYRHAFPLLKKHGLPATLFVYTDFIGSGGEALSWAQLSEMAASGLIDVQAHSKSHRNLIDRMPGESEERYRQGLDAEARVPRELLEKRLPVQVRHYALPYGDANEAVLEVLSRQRYRLAVTVNPGGNAFFAQPMLLRRTMIFGDHDLEDFKAKLQISRPLAVSAGGAP
ncbi:polysaccharide deacetylase family protein [Azohydromonas caseinilytica]|uniref:Polysaccharide deacetylase family protein n=1 Tax=Azohydromonas caseinilytica TaxID=2728836 RepID=A0A848FCM4_9BURK|nr:polysaccharide deacetylase family protein [Azohydromonas caseinilytica]NML16525.1 polysaccharide deacetylase family protein [Azohydromonas caseinilytica]